MKSRWRSLAFSIAAAIAVAGALGFAPQARADVKEFGEVTGKLFDPKALEPEMVRAGSLEIILNQKASRLIEAAMVPPGQYRTHAFVTVTKKPKAEPEKKKEGDAEESNNPGGLLSVDSLISRFESGQPKPKRADGTEPDEFDYTVEAVQLQVTFSDKVSPTVRADLEKDLKAEFTPTFGDKLKLTVKRSPGIQEDPVKPKTFAENMAPVQFPVMAIILGLMFIGALLVFKLVPSRQGAMPFRASIELNNTDAQALQSGGGRDASRGYGESPAYGEGPAIHPREASVASEDDAKLLTRQIKGLEQQLAAYVRQKTSVAGAVLHEWAAADDFIKITLFLEALAKEGVSIDRTEFRPEVIDAIRGSRGATTRLSLRERAETLEEVYWGLVSNTFLGEDRTVGQFRFLESVNDEAIVELLAGEAEEAQATVLLGLSERRAARVLSRLEPQRREILLREIFTANPMESAALTELAGRLSDRVGEIRRTQPDVVRMSEGVESLIPILETMDFESQYATAQSFLFMQQDLKAKIEARYFNVAMLPDAKPEFLESIFQDRQPGWMHALLAMYDEEFRKRALASLPSIQQRMIADQANVAVTPSAAWGALRELNDEILDRVARGELALQSIFHEEPLAIAGGAEPATGAAVEPPQANEPQTAEQAYEPEGGNQNAA